LIVARKLGRQVIGFELSEEYTKAGTERLNAAASGDPLTGAPEPTMSGKQTPGKQTATAPEMAAVPPVVIEEAAAPSVLVVKDETTPVETPEPEAASAPAVKSAPLTRRLYDILNETIAAAFEKTHDGWAADRVLTDPQLQASFYEECVRLGLPLSQKETCLRLLKLRKKGGALKGSKRYSVSADDCEPYLHACEIAWATIHAASPDISLEEILIDPEQATAFDAVATQFAAGFTSLEYRWGALRLRKSLKKARERGLTLKPPRRFWLGTSFAKYRPQDVADARGLYLVYEGDDCLYVGGTTNLRQRLQEITTKPSQHWGAKRRQLSVKYFTTPKTETDLLAWVSAVISQQETIPRLNLNELDADHGS
jgi:hypothetical protein